MPAKKNAGRRLDGAHRHTAAGIARYILEVAKYTDNAVVEKASFETAEQSRSLYFELFEKLDTPSCSEVDWTGWTGN